MAYGLRLSGIGKKAAKELFRIEPTWWKISEVRELVAQDWITTNQTGSYSDDHVDISLDEARKLHERFKPEILKTIAYNVSCLKSHKTSTSEHAPKLVEDYSEYLSQLEEELYSIEAALGSDADNFAHFQLCIFEWDSGC